MSYFDLRLGSASLDVSVVIPVRDEAPNVARLAEEVAAAMARTRWSWECIWVDDGSRDDTLARLTSLSHADTRHRVVELERNYGQSAALGAGFVASRGAMIATLDGDGQNDPSELPRLTGLLVERKLDIVNSYRERSQFGPVRRLSSKIANAFRNRLTGERVRDVGSSLRVVRRECLDGIFVFKGMHRFLPTLIRINGFSRMEEVPVRHRARWNGASKYGISNRLWVGVADTLAVRWMSRRMVAPREATADASQRQEAFK